MTHTLRIELGDRSYPVVVGTGIMARAGKILGGLGFCVPPVVVSNATVMRLHGNALLSSLEASFGKVPVVRVGDGERFKNRITLEKIYEGLFRAGADRNSWIVAFGGGVIGDLAGFAAATYLRGIPYVGIPTTLLAQVDSSVGGKVGINVARGKNLIGAFHQPSAVLSDTAVLRTLSARELASGLYEVVKCGAIRSEPLLEYLEVNLQDVIDGKSRAIEHVILGAVRIKAEIVGSDEREADLRMLLNYGHTVGHALEAATSYHRFKHGEAVAWGMIAAAALGTMLIGFPEDEARRLATLIHRIERLPSLRGVSAATVWAAVKRDKKFRDGRIRMVLQRRTGQAEVVDNLDPTQMRTFIAEFIATAGKRG